MNKPSKSRTGRRVVALLSATALAISLLTAGCGKSDEQAQPAQPGQTQPGNTDQSNDPLAQFPPVKLPFTVDPKASIADYQGGNVTGKEFETFLRTIAFFNPGQGQMIEAADKKMVEDFARQYTATKLLAGRADQTAKDAAQKQAETSYDRLKQQYLTMLGNDEAKYDKLLQNQGLSKDDVVAQMTLINESVEVLKKGITDADLNKLYEADKSAYTMASVRHILISTKDPMSGTEKRKPEEALKLANEIEAKLKKGEDFAKLAKQYSEDPGSKDNGGLYENADVNEWVPEFKNAALTLPIGQISDPVKTDYGYHIIKVEKREKNDQKLREKAIETRYDTFLNTELAKQVTKWNIPEVKAAK